MNKPSNICDELDDYDEKGDCDYFEEPVEEVIIDDIKVEGKYKVFQDAILASMIQMTKSMPAVKLTDGTYVQGNRRIYIHYNYNTRAQSLQTPRAKCIITTTPKRTIISSFNTILPIIDYISKRNKR